MAAEIRWRLNLCGDATEAAFGIGRGDVSRDESRGSEGGHVCDYVHLNPARARLIQIEERLSAYRWSSYAEHLKPPKQRLEWLRTERLLGEWGVGEDNAVGRRQFEAGMEQRKKQEMSKESGDWRQLRRGWCWGPNSFREELLEQIGAKKGAQPTGEELGESDEPKAQRMVAAMLQEAGWKEAELERRLKGDMKKGRMAARLRAETTMTWRWIAERLVMGHWRTAVNAARRAGSARRK